MPFLSSVLQVLKSLFVLLLSLVFRSNQIRGCFVFFSVKIQRGNTPSFIGYTQPLPAFVVFVTLKCAWNILGSEAISKDLWAGFYCIAENWPTVLTSGGLILFFCCWRPGLWNLLCSPASFKGVAILLFQLSDC